MTVLRGAISGFGEVAARAHLAGWRTRSEVQIVAIHDPVSARRHAAINLIKNIRVYDDLELMLNGEKLDFLDIASPPAYHAVTATMALDAGVHVLIEKPLCLDQATLSALMRSAGQTSRVLMCVHNWKHAPAYRRAKELAAAGRLGEVSYVALMRLRAEAAGQGGKAPGTAERWRLDGANGGGILVDHGWHAFYLAQFLLGGAQPLGISAYVETAPGRGVEQMADLRVDYSGGRIASLHLSWRAPVRRTAAMLYGADGILEIEGNRLVLTPRAGAIEDCSVEDAPEDSYHPSWFAGVAADFVRAIAEGPDGLTMRENLNEAASALALTLAARHSSEHAGARVAIV